METPVEAVLQALSAPGSAGKRAWIGLSGGLDSMVLLHAADRCRQHGWGGALAAIHVHHGLHPDADRWRDHCAAACHRLRVSFHERRVDAQPAPGASPEAAARAARYRAFSTLLAPGDLLLLGHHADDQAETLLLQLLRGAGVAGLAAMPERAPLGPGWLVRPLLGISRRSLHELAVRHGIAWCEDPSNEDSAVERNFLLHEIMPRLRQRWPAVGRSLVASAAHCADALAVIEARAAADLALLGGGAATVTDLPLAPLREWPVARRNHLLRYWLRQLGLAPPGRRHLARIDDELLPARADRNPCIRWSGTDLRRYRGRLYALPTPLPVDPEATLPWDGRGPLRLAHGTLSLGHHGQAGLRTAGPFEVRFRRGGERLQPSGRRHHQALKKLLQQAAVPPWQRERWPLLYRAGELVAVPGLWIAQGHAVAPGAEGPLLAWEPAGGRPAGSRPD